jgi:hypothetical protein
MRESCVILATHAVVDEAMCGSSPYWDGASPGADRDALRQLVGAAIYGSISASCQHELCGWCSCSHDIPF